MIENKMKDNYNQISELVTIDEKYNGATVSLHLNKLTEEVGEFAQAVNKTLGIKSKKQTDTNESIIEDICEEASDVLQIISGLCFLNGISYERLMDKLKEKNTAYHQFIYKKAEMQLVDVVNEFKLGQKVYHKRIYDGREQLTIIGIRTNSLELEGDYSGGTHNVCQSDWLPVDGVLLTKNI